MSEENNKASVYLIIVSVGYSCQTQTNPIIKYWPVRIVAFNEDAANRGAMAYAELQDAGFDKTVRAFAHSAVLVDTLGRIDCIAESTIR
jgi:hypothetical protein